MQNYKYYNYDICKASANVINRYNFGKELNETKLLLKTMKMMIDMTDQIKEIKLE